ncbi:carbohydrate-binding module family 50 protein [Aspergillus luchuensis CBS 106.47]|uniref:Carbohydrate-binding module family 50 protein n=1 Tax=Aspergillus luchuensis (strain CBS 106.47) TaxID=1137211 RepID=A0A1M3THB5_ASPLC|nr:carbohydrate-binding module family 50 protein [Aspergillus luchuensis CBS 106.47]
MTGIAANCNRWYTAQKGDYCYAVEKAFGLTPQQFQQWNPAVSLDCLVNFWPGYAYCVGVGPAANGPHGPTMPGIAPNCIQFYTAKKGDTCYAVEKAFGISPQQFQQWNPAVSLDCLVNFWADYAYCVGVGPVAPTSTSTVTATATATATSASTSTSSTTLTTTMVTTNATYSTRNPITSYNQTITPIDTAWPPTKTHPGQPKDCDKWHLIAPGDTCRSIYQRHGNSITMDELLEWNPDLKADCDYPIAGYWVCVGIKRPALTIIYPTTNDTVPDPTPWTPRPTPTETSVYPPTKTQPGLAPSCSAFYEAQPSDTCDQILASNPMLKFPLLLEWNPALKSDCFGILPGYFYCIAAYNDTNRPAPPTVTNQPYPLKPGTAKNCTAWYKSDDGDTCDLIVEMFGTFDKAQFVAWNPDIGVECYGLENGYYYCVADPSTPKTRTRPVITAMSFPTAHSRRQPGVTKDCNKWWLVSIHDDCYDIMHFNGITMADLYTWNPALSGKRNCLEGLVPDTEVCVGVMSSSSSSSTTAAPSSTVPGASFKTGLVTAMGERN